MKSFHPGDPASKKRLSAALRAIASTPEHLKLVIDTPYDFYESFNGRVRVSSRDTCFGPEEAHCVFDYTGQRQPGSPLAGRLPQQLAVPDTIE